MSSQRTAIAALFATVLAASATLAHASPELVVNGGFEIGTPGGNPYDAAVNSQRVSVGDPAIAGWSVINAEIAWIGANNPYSITAASGDNFLDLTGWFTQGGGVQQVLATTAGQTYTVQFDLGNSNLYNYGTQNSMRVQAAGLDTTVYGTVADQQNAWMHETLSFTATGSSTTLTFTQGQAYYYVGLDNVSVTATAVPEPASSALLLAGLGAVALAARRRRG